MLLLGIAPAHGEVTIELTDGDDALLQNLRARLALSSEPCDAPAWRVRRYFDRAEKDMRPALHALGYYQATIDKQLDREEDCWQAHFVIDPGPRVTVRRRSVIVDGEAADDERLAAVLEGLPLPEGAPLNHAQYEAIKDSLRQFAAERGYLDFRLTRQQLRVYPEQAVAEIDIEAESGPRYRFGELTLGEQPLNEGLVRRLARIEPGDPYDVRRLTALDRALSDAGYYSRVEVRARRDQAQDLAVPVDVEFEAAPRHAWRAGIGYATDTGPRLSLGYDNRYLNAAGHHLSSELRLSPVESGLSVDYQVPGRNPHRENFSFGAQLLHEDTDTAVSDSVALIGRQTIKAGGWTQTRFIELLHEQSTVGGVDTDATLLMPGIGLDRTEADDLLRTTRGFRVHLETRAAVEGLLSTATLLQLRGSAKGIHRFGEGGRVTGRLDAGVTLGDSTSNLPASLRFFAGGDNSVRGYEYKSLGPEDADGDPLGGRNLLTGSVEYEHPVVADDWWAAAFVDVGNAFDVDDVELKVGYGVGVRWYSPVGRLRLDLAFPNDTEEDDWRLHFGLGADL